MSDRWLTKALEISGFTRQETLGFDEPKMIMEQFRDWLLSHSSKQPVFISDNNGFDWQFINYYFHHFLGSNPFGYSSTNLGSLYKGLVKDMTKSFKHLRKTMYSHIPIDDVRGNAEALLYLKHEMGLKMNLYGLNRMLKQTGTAPHGPSLFQLPVTNYFSLIPLSLFTHHFARLAVHQLP